MSVFYSKKLKSAVCFFTVAILITGLFSCSNSEVGQEQSSVILQSGSVSTADTSSESNTLNSTDTDNTSSQSDESSQMHEYGDDVPKNAVKWLDLFGDDTLIMTVEQVEERNKTMLKDSDCLVDLRDFPENLGKKALTDKINDMNIPQLPKYTADGKISNSMLNSYKSNRNLSAVKDSNEVLKGVTVERCSLRSLPTSTPFYLSQGAGNFDQIQETGLYINMPVCIMHTSADGEWYFVQSYFYYGWVEAENIALISNDEDWQNCFLKESFVTVTASLLNISDKYLDMSATLPLFSKNETSYTVKLPMKNSDGSLTYSDADIPFSDACEGFLPFTKSNVYIQAFKYEGTNYGWGDMNLGVDCSSYIANIYRCFGFMFPRNSNQQQHLVGTPSVALYDMTIATKKATIAKYEAPYPLYLNGHVVLLLGKRNGNNYIIHASGGNVLMVKETPLDYNAGSGNYYDRLIWAAPIK